jgi:hypothetical protein
MDNKEASVSGASVLVITAEFMGTRKQKNPGIQFKMK